MVVCRRQGRHCAYLRAGARVLNLFPSVPLALAAADHLFATGRYRLLLIDVEEEACWSAAWGLIAD